MAILIAAAAWLAFGMVGANASAESVAPRSEKFVLTGLVYVEGGRGLAWLQEPTFTNNQTVIVRVGDSVGPYRLTKILDDQVELEGPGGKVSVPLAGTGGAVSVASIPGSVDQSKSGELAPQPENPQVIVVERGDPRRNFPVADLLIGGGAQITGESPAPQPPVERAVDRGIVPAWMQVQPPATPTGVAAAQNLSPAPPQLLNPNAIIIPRGDPRREFPASSLLIGAGAQVFR